MPFERLPTARQWQEEALKAWAGNAYRGIAEVVTGGGKTIFAMLCMDAALRASIAKSVVVVVPTLALLDQWYVALREELGLAESDLALWSGKQRPAEPSLINVMVLNTARSEIERVGPVENSLLVADECHRMSSPVNATVLARPFGATLGISATPDDDYNSRLDEVLVPHLGRIVFRYSLDDAYSQGILAQFDLTNVHVDLLADEQQEYSAWTRRIRLHLKRNPRSASGSDEALQVLLRRRAIVAAKARLRVPVAVRMVEANKGARTIVFHEFKSDAEAIVERLRSRGNSTTIYHSGIASSMRRDNLRLFRRGQFDVLVTCRALDEGINIPEVQVAVIASATASSRQRLQRLGRVLRPAPGKDRASIYTLYATEPEERRLAIEAKEIRSANSVSWQRTRISRG